MERDSKIWNAGDAVSGYAPVASGRGSAKSDTRGVHWMIEIIRRSTVAFTPRAGPMGRCAIVATDTHGQ